MKVKRKIQAVVMALIMFFVTVASPVLGTVEVKASEDELKIRFHYTREDKTYDSWNVATWDGTVSSPSEFTVGEDGVAVAEAVVNPGSKKIGFIVRRSTSDNEWAEKDWDGDRFVSVDGYISGTINVYVTSGVEAVDTDYSQAVEGEYVEPVHDGLVINLYIDKTKTDDNWGLWLWDDIGTDAEYTLFKANDEGKLSVSYNVKAGATWVGLIVRDDNWNKDPDGDRTVDVSQYVDGEINVYLESGKGEFEVNYDKAIKGAKVTSAVYDVDTIIVKTSMEVENLDEAFKVISEETEVTIKKVEKTEDNKYVLYFEESLDNTKAYKVEFGGYSYKVTMPSLYKTESFINNYTYDGDDLGATWTKEKTTFKVWAPLASEVKVNLYDNGKAGEGNKINEVEMTQAEKGVWVAEVQGDLNGTYYTYSVNNSGEISEACDPYARTTGVNGDRAMVIDLDSTNPDGWENDENPNADLTFNDAVIYELHVRDASIDESSGVSDENKGNFLGLTETGNNTILDHMVDLGITHLHLLPIYDFSSVDEEKDGFNWGYDPKNYNVPEGSYSSDPYNGEVRVKEMKQMVQTLHNNGISVVMDVVYNHVSDAGKFCFNKIVPNYFSRMKENGGYSSDSGCGNDTASEHVMVRKYIVDSVKYWADEYHIDGFRFDLVGLIDTVTINEIMKEVWADHPDVVFYGEGWEMNKYDTGVSMTTQKNSTEVPGFAFFNDTLRDAIKGSVFDEGTGYVSGKTGVEKDIQDCFIGLAGDWCTTPTQTVNYNSCHDNNTLYDRLKISRPDASEEDIVKMNNLAAVITLTSQGIPFIHAGEEILRSKPLENVSEDGSKYDHNSYASGDKVNSIKWNTLENKAVQDVYDYYKGLIAFRKNHKVLRMTTAEDVKANIKTVEGLDANVTAFEINGSSLNDDDLFVVFNPNTEATKVTLPVGKWDVYVNAETAGTKAINTVSGEVSVDAISAMVLVKSEEEETTTEVTTSTEDSTTTETTTSTEDSTTTETTTSTEENATTEETTSTEDSTTTETTTSTEDSTTTEETTSTEDSTTTETTTSTEENATTEVTTSTEDSTTTETTASTEENATTEETTSTEDNTTTEETTSTEDSTTTEATTSTEDSTTTEITTSTEETATTEATTSTEENATTEATTSTEENATTETTTSTEDSTTTETTTSTEDSTTTETTTSTEENATTETTTSTEENATTEETTSTEDSTTTEETTSTEENATTEVEATTTEQATTEKAPVIDFLPITTEAPATTEVETTTADEVETTTEVEATTTEEIEATTEEVVSEDEELMNKVEVSGKVTVYVNGDSKSININNLPDGAKVSYKSDNKNIATAKKGNVVGLKKGNTIVTVTVSLNDIEKEFVTVVKVKNPIVSKVTVAKSLSVKKDEKATIKVVVPEGKDVTITYKSSNKKIATVSSKGVVKGVKKGSTKVKVTVTGSDGVSKTFVTKVKVSK